MHDDQPTTFTVNCAAFEGPVELLLELISRRKLAVDAISVASVVDDFLAAVDDAGDMPLEVASKFLLVAATLIQIKTNRLLPDPAELDVDDDLLADSERDLLLARLLAARTFTDVADVLRAHLETGARFVPRAAQAEEHLRSVAPDLLRQITVEDLARIALRALTAEEPEPELTLEHVAPVRASVRGALEDLARSLPGAGPTTYRALCAGRPLIEAVVRFLALLELLKAGCVALAQEHPFDDIDVVWVMVDEGYDPLVALGDAATDWDVVAAEDPA
jgi:segregation and condensation protein A